MTTAMLGAVDAVRWDASEGSVARCTNGFVAQVDVSAEDGVLTLILESFGRFFDAKIPFASLSWHADDKCLTVALCVIGGDSRLDPAPATAKPLDRIIHSLRRGAPIYLSPSSRCRTSLVSSLPPSRRDPNLELPPSHLSRVNSAAVMASLVDTHGDSRWMSIHRRQMRCVMGMSGTPINEVMVDTYKGIPPGVSMTLTNSVALTTMSLKHHGPLSGGAEQREKPPLRFVFAGDSLVQHFERSPAWASLIGALGLTSEQTANLGIGGDQVQFLNFRLREAVACARCPPEVVALLIGTNNSDHTSGEVADGILSLLDTLHLLWEDTHVAIIALPPRGEQRCAPRRKHLQVNALLAAALKGRHRAMFVDPWKADHVAIDAVLPTDAFYDYLHLTDSEYEHVAGVLAEAIRPLFSE